MRNVRGVDPAIWQRARAEGVRRGLTMGQVVTAALEGWLGGVDAASTPPPSESSSPPSTRRERLAGAYDRMKG